MTNRKTNISLLIITLTLFMVSAHNAIAQQMVLQILGGGYRFDGPTQITFAPIQTSSVNSTPSEISIRDITTGGYTIPPEVAEDGFISIEDQNGGTPFEVHINSSGDLVHNIYNGIPPEDAYYYIGADNFYVINNTSGTENITTLTGLSDGLSLNAETDTYINLTTDRTIANGTGQQPGKWKIYPGFKIEIPTSTPVGTYSTTITFTII